MTTTTPQDPTPADTKVGVATDRTDGGRDTAGGDITRLNAFDGLFLRAEHLTAMQDYARDLAYALGAAGGSGVVDGYDVTATDEGLQVDAGLAISAAGRPLRSRKVVELPWEMFPSLKDAWFRIEVGPADWGFDETTVQALLCDAPCSGGTRATLHRAEGVRIHITSVTDAGFDARTHKRAWLASHLFAEEEKEAGAWPGAAAQTSLGDRTWRPPPPGVLTERVPLAVVIPPNDEAGWTVDVWAARRDRGAPPPDDRWRWRIAMRPWPVFLAQVLQFQDHYAAVGLAGPSQPKLGQVTSRLSAILEQIRGGETKDSSAGLETLLAQFAVTGKPLAAGLQLPALPDVGITELPPAGLLMVDPVEGEGTLNERVQAEVERLLAQGASVRVRRCGRGDVGLAFEQARHRRRIPIGDRERPTPLDVLVPVENGRRIGDWVVFVRRDETATEVDEVDEVDLYVIDDRENAEKFAADVAAAREGRIPEGAGAPVTLRYPAGSWTQPQGGQRGALGRIQKLRGGTPVVVERQ